MTGQSNDLAAIILAAGMSRRFGVANKLHALLDGDVSVVERVIERVVEFSFKRPIVVLADDDHALTKLANQYQMTQVINDRPQQGMGCSISLGVSSLDQSQFSGVAIFLGDMPHLCAETVVAAVKQFQSQGGRQIVRPCFDQQAGHPVIFPRRFFTELIAIDGDVGANSIIQRNREHLTLMPTSDYGVLADIDVPSDIDD